MSGSSLPATLAGHWDSSAEMLAALIAVNEGIDQDFNTEYAGRTYTRCTACNAAISEAEAHRAGCAWAAIRTAIAKATGAA